MFFADQEWNINPQDQQLHNRLFDPVVHSGESLKIVETTPSNKKNRARKRKRKTSESENASSKKLLLTEHNSPENDSVIITNVEEHTDDSVKTKSTRKQKRNKNNRNKNKFKPISKLETSTSDVESDLTVHNNSKVSDKTSKRKAKQMNDSRNTKKQDDLQCSASQQKPQAVGKSNGDIPKAQKKKKKQKHSNGKLDDKINKQKNTPEAEAQIEQKNIGTDEKVSVKPVKKKRSIDVNELRKHLQLDSESTNTSLSPSKGVDASHGDELSNKLRNKLGAARFRYLNEQLYTVTGEEALELMDEESFITYHQGFQTQLAKWPVNPLDRIISWIQSKPKHWVVGDFGCGDAKLAKAVENKVHSFDLVSTNSLVTACDMAKVPLADNSLDVAVFCLSLMGTNVTDFLAEANRVLKTGGALLIAEVKSRFDRIGPFVRKIKKLNFDLKLTDLQDKMFLWFELTKLDDLDATTLLPTIELMPCIYKKR